MFIKVCAFSCSDSSFLSPKTGKTIRTIRFMGDVFDAVGDSVPIHAQSGFDCQPSFLPKKGEDALLDVDKFEIAGGEIQARFRDIRPVPKSSGKGL